MSIKTVSVNDSTLSLGVIMINDKPHLAILHFRDPDGNPRLITDQMKRTSAVSLKHFEDILNKLESQQRSLINRVSSQGIQLGEKLISHDLLKTTNEWQTFIKYLENPIPIEGLEEFKKPMETELELVDLSLLDNIDLNELAKNLYKTIKKALDNDEDFPDLSAEEKLFLKHSPDRFAEDYSALLAGNFDIIQLSNLQLEFTK